MLITALLLFAQNTPGADSGTRNPKGSLQSTQGITEAVIPHVTWFTQWDQAVKEAERLNRPILLQSAAPLCSGVPGMW
jgi:hypothetical protein